MDGFNESDVDYNNNIIYKIYCKTDKTVPPYFGSTCFEETRWNKHVKKYHQKKYTDDHKLFNAFDKYGIENFEFVKIEDWPCDNYTQARMRENYWYNKTGETLNSIRPYITEEERRQSIYDWARIETECKECGLTIDNGSIPNHKKSNAHSHMKYARKMIEDGKNQFIDQYLVLKSGKIICCCYLELENKKIYDDHVKSDIHRRYMKVIKELLKNQEKKNNKIDKTDLIKIAITPNTMMICDCASNILVRDYNHHILLPEHKELLEIKNRVEDDFDGKEIIIPSGYIMCDKCYIIYKPSWARHFTEKHNEFSKAVTRMKQLFSKRKQLDKPNLGFSELYNDTVMISILPVTDPIKIIPNLISLSITSNNEIVCECSTKVSVKEMDRHLASSEHLEIIHIRSRIESEMDEKEIETKKNYIICEGCYMLYDKKNPGRHKKSQKHEKYSKIVVTIKELLKKKREPGNINKKFCELTGDLVRVDIIPMINLI